MKDALIVSALSMVPRNEGARWMGRIARSRASRWLTRAFVRAYDVDLDEADGEIGDYPTLEALFTRRLAPGQRPIDDRPGALVSPVDGRCAAVGRSVGGILPIAAGRPLDLAALVGPDLDGGEHDVAVLYLSPRDYHRVHVPREGAAVAWRYLPGTLWPVFPAAVRRVPNLFSRNERMAVALDTDGGRLWVVLVGAFGVGRISVTVCDPISNSGGPEASGRLPRLPLARGAELGVFHLGSTVVLLAKPDAFRFEVSAGDTVRVGQVLAQLGGV